MTIEQIVTRIDGLNGWKRQGKDCVLWSDDPVTYEDKYGRPYELTDTTHVQFYAHEGKVWAVVAVTVWDDLQQEKVSYVDVEFDVNDVAAMIDELQAMC